MNVPWIIFHLEEAKEQIEGTIKRLQEPDFDEAELLLDVRHMLHHIHTAYNSRNGEDTDHLTEADFLRNQRPPVEIVWE
jgi:hypothetical protein